jgi:hypothetical protein
MTDDSRQTQQRWKFLGSGAALLMVAIVTAGLMNAWLFGALLLAGVGLMVQGLRLSAWKTWVRVVVSLTVLGLAFLLWDNNASQPRIRVDALQLRQLPSSAQPGRVELIARNTGDLPADIVVHAVAQLAPAFRNAADVMRANIEDDLEERLDEASPTPATGTLQVGDGQTTLVNVAVPFSERAWVFGRGEASLVVVARITYRDRVFTRERVFCQFTNPQSGQWISCPFLND